MYARDPSPANGSPGWGAAAQAMYRAAQAVSRPGGTAVFAQLVQELADILGVATAFVAVFTDASRSELRTLAVVLDGQPLGSFDYALEGSPCAQVVGHAYRHIASGVSAEFEADTLFASQGMDSYAAFPLFDSGDAPLGLLVAMDRRPIADAALAEALLKIFAGRIAAEIEQQRAHEAAEAVRRASEEQHRAIFDASADPLILWNSQYRRVDVNPAYERVFGYARDEVLGRHWDRPDDDEAYAQPRRELVRRALAGETCRAELASRRKDGTIIQIEIHATPFRHRGEPHVLAIARDVTERRHAEERLRASEEQYRAIFNASADALVLRDATFRAVDVNPAYLTMSGFGRDEVLAAPLVLTQPDDAVRSAHRALHERAVAGETLHFEAQGVRKDGTRFDAEVRGVPVLYRGAPHVLYATRDITERRAAEAEREKLGAQLRQAQKMEAIGQLTGGIAHDFNNILTAVIGYLVLGLERAAAGNDPKLVRQLESAHLAAQRARDLIAQMLTFARGKGGDHRALAPGPLVRQSLQLLRSTLPSSVLLEASIRDESLPAIVADAVQFEQVLFNLCINARDAMKGSGTIRVDLAAVRHSGVRCCSCGANVGYGPWVELGVADTGSGIAPEVIERMFEPFFSTKAVGRGSGMGLAMVHGIVHNHGGHVVVTSDPGHGARFGVLWPPAATAAVADAPASSAAHAPGQRLAGRVLVVEDEPQVGAMMAELLGGWGLQVVSMGDALAARDWLLEPANAVDLLITDHTMPQITGLQLAQLATQVRPTLPVLLYTGDPETEEAAVLQRHGVRALLRKPIEPRTMLALLQRWLPAG
ncbi:MAG: Sensor histidine kinase RcsC [Burkholderiaceae bacterium]|nr:Sensor histidine kinase RcsC [Burkholderiaceae bacterium]